RADSVGCGFNGISLAANHDRIEVQSKFIVRNLFNDQFSVRASRNDKISAGAEHILIHHGIEYFSVSIIGFDSLRRPDVDSSADRDRSDGGGSTSLRVGRATQTKRPEYESAQHKDEWPGRT